MGVSFAVMRGHSPFLLPPVEIPVQNTLKNLRKTAGYQHAEREGKMVRGNTQGYETDFNAGFNGHERPLFTSQTEAYHVVKETVSSCDMWQIVRVVHVSTPLYCYSLYVFYIII